MCLAAGLRPDPLGELTALPRPPSWIKGRGMGKGKGREGKGDGSGRRKKERGGPPNV